MYIVIGGGGKVGEALAKRLLGVGHEVAVIEEEPTRATRLANILKGRLMVVCGSCCDAAYLAEAGTEHADIVCATTGQDDTNLALCEIAGALYKPPRCIARVNNPRNERIFNSLGIQTVSSTAVVSKLLAENMATTPTRASLTLRHGEYSILEVDVPNTAEFKAEGGRHPSEIDFPKTAFLVAVSHGQQYEPVDDNTVLLSGDTAIIFVHSDDADEAVRAIRDL